MDGMVIKSNGEKVGAKLCSAKKSKNEGEREAGLQFVNHINTTNKIKKCQPWVHVNDRKLSNIKSKRDNHKRSILP